jgi:hypothetical protein
MLLPAGLPGYEVRVASNGSPDDIGASTIMACSELQLDLRLHDYFMGKSASDDPNIVLTRGRYVTEFEHSQRFRT